MRVGFQALANTELIAEYRRRLDARAVLEHYDAQNCTEMSGDNGTTEIVHSCLIDRVEPHHNNGDMSPSACLNVEKKLYCCYSSTWSGDLFYLIAKLEGKPTLADALPVIGQFLTGAVSEGNALLEELAAAFVVPTHHILELPSYHERILTPWSVIHPYLYEERGITPEAASQLHLGYDDRENRIVFPHFWEGRLVGWQKRAIPARPGWPGSSPEWPKYRSSSGMPKSETLYNYDRARGFSNVIVVESPMSVAKAVSLGINNVVATFGAKVSRHQIDLLKSFDTVWVWFDADPAGHAGERKVVTGLYRHAQTLVVPPDQGRDLGDFVTQDQVIEKLATAVPAALAMASYPQERRSRVG